MIVLVVYNSIFFRTIDEMNESRLKSSFDSKGFARNLFEQKLIMRADSAINLQDLIPLIQRNPKDAFNRYSRSLTIGNIRYFLIQGDGTVQAIDDDAIIVLLNQNAQRTKVSIATEFIYGNAIRDASGLVDINDFSNTADLNSISENVNAIIRKEVLPTFMAKVKTGDEIKFAGAIELNQKYIGLDSIEILPIQLSILE
jgi:predicted lipoprotein